jgi:hypothetical protein
VRPLLDRAAPLWPTPKVSTGDYSYSGGDHDKIAMNLHGASKLWGTLLSTSRAQTPREVDHGIQLANQVKKLWGTPRSSPNENRGTKDYGRSGGNNLSEQTTSWATPTSRDWKDGSDPSSLAKTNSLLGRQAPRSGIVGPGSLPSTRRLNPRFVEWLMGMPLGWTDCGVSVTPSFQSWRRRHLSLLRAIFMLDAPPR